MKHPAKSLRILCADDDPSIGVVMRIALESEGHQVECVEDGEQARELIIEKGVRFDLVITDHDMPRMAGLKLVDELRRSGYDGKILVHSSGLRKADTERYRLLDVACILPKPASLSGFLSTIQAIGRTP